MLELYRYESCRKPDPHGLAQTLAGHGPVHLDNPKISLNIGVTGAAYVRASSLDLFMLFVSPLASSRGLLDLSLCSATLRRMSWKAQQYRLTRNLV